MQFFRDKLAQPVNNKQRQVGGYKSTPYKKAKKSGLTVQNTKERGGFFIQVSIVSPVAEERLQCTGGVLIIVLTG